MKLLGHIRASWEPIGSKKLLTEGQGNSWCNELPNVTDTNVIGAFLSRTTCESLVHKLGHKGLRTTKELLDVATNHALAEDAVGRFSTASKAR